MLKNRFLLSFILSLMLISSVWATADDQLLEQLGKDLKPAHMTAMQWFYDCANKVAKLTPEETEWKKLVYEMHQTILGKYGVSTKRVMEANEMGHVKRVFRNLSPGVASDPEVVGLFCAPNFKTDVPDEAIAKRASFMIAIHAEHANEDSYDALARRIHSGGASGKALSAVITEEKGAIADAFKKSGQFFQEALARFAKLAKKKPLALQLKAALLAKIKADKLAEEFIADIHFKEGTPLEVQAQVMRWLGNLDLCLNPIITPEWEALNKRMETVIQ